MVASLTVSDQRKGFGEALLLSAVGFNIIYAVDIICSIQWRFLAGCGTGNTEVISEQQHDYGKSCVSNTGLTFKLDQAGQSH